MPFRFARPRSLRVRFVVLNSKCFVCFCSRGQAARRDRQSELGARSSGAQERRHLLANRRAVRVVSAEQERGRMTRRPRPAGASNDAYVNDTI